MSHALRSRPAESMIETLIAILVIVIASTAALSMLNTSLKGNAVIGEKLVALELAREGLDAVKSIRDTNYLLFSSNPDECWDKLGLTITSDCSTATAVADGEEYYLQQQFSSDPMYRWNLIELGSNPRDGYLNLFTFDATTSGHSFEVSGAAHIPYLSDWHNAAVSSLTNQVSNKFRRVVTTELNPLDSSGNPLCASGECYLATVTVSWTINSLTQSVSLSSLINNVY